MTVYVVQEISVANSLQVVIINFCKYEYLEHKQL